MDKPDRHSPLVQSFLLQEFIRSLINKIHDNTWAIPTEEEKEEYINEVKSCTSTYEAHSLIIKVLNKFGLNNKKDKRGDKEC